MASRSSFREGRRDARTPRPVPPAARRRRAPHDAACPARAGSTAAPSDAHPRDADAVSDDATDIPAADRNLRAAPLRESPRDRPRPLPERGSYRRTSTARAAATPARPAPARSFAATRTTAPSSSAEYLGDDKTNNEAEYLALLRGLSEGGRSRHLPPRRQGRFILVVNQVNGAWKVKKEHLVPLWRTARDLIDANFPSSFRVARRLRTQRRGGRSRQHRHHRGSQVGAGAGLSRVPGERAKPRREKREVAAAAAAGGTGGAAGGGGGRRMRGAGHRARARFERSDAGEISATDRTRRRSRDVLLGDGDETPRAARSRRRAGSRESARESPSRRLAVAFATATRAFAVATRALAITRAITFVRTFAASTAAAAARPSPWRARRDGRRLSRRRASSAGSR